MLHSKLIILLSEYQYNIEKVGSLKDDSSSIIGTAYELQYIRNIFRYFDMLENYNLETIKFFPTISLEI
jgi:hypothetical protein